MDAAARKSEAERPDARASAEKKFVTGAQAKPELAAQSGVAAREALKDARVEPEPRAQPKPAWKPEARSDVERPALAGPRACSKLMRRKRVWTPV